MTAVKTAFAVALCLAAGGIASAFTMASIQTWYAELQQPSLTPPDWIFAPVWTTLYIMMGVAAGLVWGSKERSRNASFALALFLVHLAVNMAWSLVFFRLQSPGGAFGVIVVLWVMVVILIGLFWRLSRPASVLLLPYLLWVTFASYLNAGIWYLN